ncbi:hypothetical protein BS50DRAFT_611123 [Corynespora cassiicola Philippines]|uniref:NAD(P)-binding protein n=1 Tax=Corynespora cassiicola Philippines TaxID=1448308 RepID=A0A2T2NHJ8_CORCC|nr:hypothetical protein BS50DRAFT_611123 [Corynespora cassiicola Philippines]
MVVGTVVIIGANGSLGLPAISYLLSTYTPSSAIPTVRDDSEHDPKMKKLQEIVAGFADSTNISIRNLDLASLNAVRTFADMVGAEIVEKKIPPTHRSNLERDELDLEWRSQIHIAHFSLALRLLVSFDPKEDHIDLDLLVHPPLDKQDEIVDRGLQRCGVSKVASITTIYELTRGLEKATLAVDPGGLLDSLANTPPDVSWKLCLPIYNFSFLQPVLKFIRPVFRRSADCAKDVVYFAIDQRNAGLRGCGAISS